MFFIANDVSVYRSRLNVYKTRARVVICSCANLGGTCSLLTLGQASTLDKTTLISDICLGGEQSRQFQLGGALPFFITENSTIRRGGRPIRRHERGFGRLSGSDRSGQTIGFDIAPRRSQGLLPERSSVKDHYSERVRSAVKDYCRVDRRQRLLQTAWPKTLIVAY